MDDVDDIGYRSMALPCSREAKMEMPTARWPWDAKNKLLFKLQIYEDRTRSGTVCRQNPDEQPRLQGKTQWQNLAQDMLVGTTQDPAVKAQSRRQTPVVEKLKCPITVSASLPSIQLQFTIRRSQISTKQTQTQYFAATIITVIHQKLQQLRIHGLALTAMTGKLHSRP